MSNAAVEGFVPAAKGEPGITVKAPEVESMLKPAKLEEVSLVTYRKWPPGSMAIAEGFVPAANETPPVRAPVL